jgi:hypothetical protein
MNSYDDELCHDWFDLVRGGRRYLFYGWEKYEIPWEHWARIVVMGSGADRQGMTSFHMQRRF